LTALPEGVGRIHMDCENKSDNMRQFGETFKVGDAIAKDNRTFYQ